MTEGRRIGEGGGEGEGGEDGECFWLYLSAIEQAPCPEDVHICPVPMCVLIYCTPDSHSLLLFPFLSKQTIKLSPHNKTHSRSNLTCAEKKNYSK